jgi:hypothetical protein
VIEGFPRLLSYESLDRNFCRDKNRNLRVDDADSQPGASGHQAWMS